MCGIAGLRTFNEAVDRSMLDRMCDLLEHRGPDDRGLFIDGSIGLSMRRLSIIDLSSGRQPIFNEDKSLCIVFNGEIYNFPDLRSELEKKGHRFYTNSDTETIIHLYEDLEEKCVERLRGMFAFAIWDKPKQRLFIARDRFGIKPLYYFWDGKTFLFASEIKSILAFPGFQRELDLEAMQEFFTFLYVPHTKTLFKGIHKLLPGCFMTLEGSNLSFGRYYNLPEPRDFVYSSEKEVVDHFFKIGSGAIKSHLISDVPLGAFLSGGIDSSLVVGLMSKLIDRPVDTFSIGYDGDGSSFDERQYSSRVAKIFGTNHREFIVTPDQIKSCLPTILDRLDEPFGDASVIPNYLLSEFAKQFVTVALTGLGGDEVGGGYERYLGTMIAERHKRLLSLLTNGLVLSIMKRLPDSQTGAHFPERLKRFVSYAALPMKERYYHFIAKFNAKECQELFKQDVIDPLEGDPGVKVYGVFWDEITSLKELRKLMKIDMDMYLVDDLLALSDRASMAHSLEMRVPFLDHQVVEFFWALPDHFKIKGFTKKYILKKAAERLLPKEIIYRKKMGFSVPLTVWFRGILKSYVEDVLAPENIEPLSIFNSVYVRKVLDEHFSGRRNHDEKIFALLSFVIWHYKIFRGKSW